MHLNHELANFLTRQIKKHFDNFTKAKVLLRLQHNKLFVSSAMQFIFAGIAMLHRESLLIQSGSVKCSDSIECIYCPF